MSLDYSFIGAVIPELVVFKLVIPELVVFKLVIPERSYLSWS